MEEAQRVMIGSDAPQDSAVDLEASTSRRQIRVGGSQNRPIRERWVRQGRATGALADAANGPTHEAACKNDR
eukprot:2554570-Alexandrium_andersonii.AAC.1